MQKHDSESVIDYTRLHYCLGVGNNLAPAHIRRQERNEKCIAIDNCRLADGVAGNSMIPDPYAIKAYLLNCCLENMRRLKAAAMNWNPKNVS
ncbi:Hypothetical protein NTJ_05145 [Nesidiocoris tenuis]|uniref:Glucose-methanol-choline oxidoreductase C-terminal domain-containing protein n=1 Tax=Nesidiocoris tenuis TaxID=355587 RepID=A0ABN7AJ98_9HEMI|nr:Hypothetical protein NTJ_05145 [Nesidiocoris tenuis]